MRKDRRRIARSLAALVLPAILGPAGCENTARVGSRPRLSPPEVRFVDLSVVAAPVFHLVIPPDSPDFPSRLVAVHVHLRSRHPNPVIVRPDWIRLLLPDGSLHFAFDPPRAAELLRRTNLARVDRLHLDAGSPDAPGGLAPARRARLRQLVLDELLTETRLEPGDHAEGYLVIDTGRPFEDLAGLPLELVTTDEAPPPKGADSVSLLARLSQPCEPPEE